MQHVIELKTLRFKFMQFFLNIFILDLFKIKIYIYVYIFWSTVL